MTDFDPKTYEAGVDYLDFDGGERRLPMVDKITDLPATTNVPLPVTCWVKNTGMYRMDEPGRWSLMYTLEG